MNDIINLYIGYDENESIAFHVLVQSILERTKTPVRITPIVRSQLSELKRLRTELESTDFSISRFLTPWLSNYKGWSLFVDCDFLFENDLAELWGLRDEKYAVMVCKHEYKPKSTVKFLDKVQASYEKKNWSSLMLFNNEKCEKLSNEYVNHADGLDLHQFKWLENEDLIGDIPKNWNYLCDEENQMGPAKGIHFTNGGPWFSTCRNTEFAGNWLDFRGRALLADPYKNKVLIIDDVEYEVINPQYKEKGKQADYFQLQKNGSDQKFHLKVKSHVYREVSHRYPCIYMQALGMKLAKYFNISTQDTQIVRLKGDNFLLTRDVRSEEHVEGMEPLSHHSEKVIDRTREISLLKNELDLYTKQDTSTFFTQMILFDTLIGNVQRDARSIRIFNVDHDKYVEHYHSRIETNHEFLIETNFGNFFYAKNGSSSLYTPSEILEFICTNKTEQTAIRFFNALNPRNLKNIIDECFFLNNEMKNDCHHIIDTQMDYMMEVEDYLFGN